MSTHNIPTALRSAFESIKVMPSAYTEQGLEIGDAIYHKLEKKVGIIPRYNWKANLSFKTAKALNAPVYDVPSSKVRYAYDRMV